MTTSELKLIRQPRGLVELVERLDFIWKPNSFDGNQ